MAVEYVVVRGFEYATDERIREAQRRGDKFTAGTYALTRHEAGSIIARTELPADVLKACNAAKNPILKRATKADSEAEEVADSDS